MSSEKPDWTLTEAELEMLSGEMLIPAAVQTVALGFLFNAFDRGGVTVVAPINNAAQTIGVVALGVVILGRTEASVRVVIAVAVVTTGAVLVGTAA